MRVLVLYYSNTGNTRKVAQALADGLGAELAEITCQTYLRWYGPVAMAWDVFTLHRPPVIVVAPQHAHYDLVLVGGPVWAARAAPPVLSGIGHLPDAGAVALFVTCSGDNPGSPPEPALAEMQAAAARPIAATEVFREADVRGPALAGKVEAFAAAVRVAIPGLAAGR